MRIFHFSIQMVNSVCLLSLFLCAHCSAKNEMHLVENENHLLFNWFDLRRHSSHRMLKRQTFSTRLVCLSKHPFFSRFFLSFTKENYSKSNIFCWFLFHFCFRFVTFLKRKMSLNYLSLVFISFHIFNSNECHQWWVDATTSMEAIMSWLFFVLLNNWFA